jgi:hypothetical protein
MELVMKADGQVVQTCEPVTYWKLRAVIGDVERGVAQVNQLQEQLKTLAGQRTELLQQIVGPEVDINFVTAVTWDDTKLEVTLTGAVRPPRAVVAS